MQDVRSCSDDCASCLGCSPQPNAVSGSTGLDCNYQAGYSKCMADVVMHLTRMEDALKFTKSVLKQLPVDQVGSLPPVEKSLRSPSIVSGSSANNMTNLKVVRGIVLDKANKENSKAHTISSEGEKNISNNKSFEDNNFSCARTDSVLTAASDMDISDKKNETPEILKVTETAQSYDNSKSILIKRKMYAFESNNNQIISLRNTNRLPPSNYFADQHSVVSISNLNKHDSKLSKNCEKSLVTESIPSRLGLGADRKDDVININSELSTFRHIEEIDVTSITESSQGSSSSDSSDDSKLSDTLVVDEDINSNISSSSSSSSNSSSSVKNGEKMNTTADDLIVKFNHLKNKGEEINYTELFAEYNNSRRDSFSFVMGNDINGSSICNSEDCTPAEKENFENFDIERIYENELSVDKKCETYENDAFLKPSEKVIATPKISANSFLSPAARLCSQTVPDKRTPENTSANTVHVSTPFPHETNTSGAIKRKAKRKNLHYTPYRKTKETANLK